MDRLPPLRLLTTFEAVSRHGSMQLAAARLNVTQPAVSQALKALEEHVGAPLIDRATRPAQLTEAGELLARAVRDGLGQIAAALEDIRALSGQEGNQVTVSCTLGMATYWLMPRLSDHQPRLLLMDEPATGLDAASTDAFVGLIEREKSRGAIVVVVTHEPKFAEAVGDRILHMSRGRLAEAAP